MLGIGSMLGAGVFAVFGPAAASAGAALWLALVLAAAVALLNALATAQLAARHPTSGGVHAFARAEVGERWGFVAGWAFVVGKTASCAAMALTASTYAFGDGDTGRVVGAVLAIAVLTWLNCRGVTRTTAASSVLGGVTLAVLGIVVAVVLLGDRPPGEVVAGPGLSGVTHAAALLFFAFAGYARVATLGEEVVEPERTIPRAVVLAWTVVVVVYAAVGLALLLALGVGALGRSSTPVQDAVDAVGADWAGPVVQVGAVAASLGALLALGAGLGRTMLAMGRVGDLPRWLAHVDPVRRVPQRAEVAAAAVAVALVLSGEVARVIGLSSSAVLVYYAVAHVSAWRQREGRRLLPRWLNVVGLAACLGLVASLPVSDVALSLGVVLGGLAVRELVRRRV